MLYEFSMEISADCHFTMITVVLPLRGWVNTLPPAKITIRLVQQKHSFIFK